MPLALDELYGPQRWQRPLRGGGVLVTFRVPGQPWDVPHRGWHSDGRADPTSGEPSQVTIFTILAPLRPRGGGTLVLTGSHHLLRHHGWETDNAKAIRMGLGARYPWLHDLWSEYTSPGIDRRKRYLDEVVLDGMPLRLVELTGEPGDAFVMRGDILHMPAPNGLDDPRIMLVKGCRII
ncbi:phytanoyl-CoA dioxygenase family protein [Actinopolymorpha sp. B9G3]|uniref:phytanoyl-CoA dioxygenase family protein n=1 Tax=Actinopolymorpha sp. B9G3 TaxID=3158970 RepID=UPI0032D92AF1